ncbi:hypothetical protein PVK06_040350 [Gossypium arboreum]|uniref:RNase H type-1 domain-containing protein n=1 Tax=Gossypium arboreum TaxID=29729 RepID=A0ABR0N587_GOSAR|nr:hypothetical protein PVK06_040350 [Gossypium arboreum]
MWNLKNKGNYAFNCGQWEVFLGLLIALFGKAGMTPFLTGGTGIPEILFLLLSLGLNPCKLEIFFQIEAKVVFEGLRLAWNKGFRQVELESDNALLIATKAKFGKDNKMVKGHMLSYMANNLFDLFVKNKSAKFIWDTLEKKYKADDAGVKKYVIGEWLKFQITEDKPIMD